MASRSATKDMTIGNPMGLILGFALPLILGNLFQQMYSMVDTIIVGQYLGVNALAAVGSVGSLQFLIIGFCLGSCAGMAIPIAQRFGARDEENLRKFVANSIWVGTAIAVIVTTVTTLLAWQILTWMQTPNNIKQDAYDYFFVILLGIPATILYNLSSAIMRALGDSKRPLYFLIFSSFLNIGLDLLFILVFQMGCAGAAWATILSQLISGLLCVWYMIRCLPIVHVRKGEWAPSRIHIKVLCNIGLPMGLQNSITAIGAVILSSAVNSLGSDAVASMTAAMKVQMMFNCAYDAMGTTMSTYCGQNLGARKLFRIGKGLRCGLGVMFVYSVISFVVLFFFGKTISLLFVSAEETAILENVQTFLFINSLAYILLALVIIVRYVIQGLGFSKIAMFAGLFEMVARTLVAFLLVPAIGFTGACLANPSAWLAADFFLIPCYFHVMKRIRTIVTDPVEE